MPADVIHCEILSIQFQGFGIIRKRRCVVLTAPATITPENRTS
jgi:hypothetical protein